ncbi:hypothetical protein SAMN04488109_0090 [Chryseolinea serpens]|uniref:Uncharacterized protein n=2 Tax=Chryseolinea serpens TaxID=947013 RepID=A0A1M5JIZ5_9BACT|nr:hypothetical protein SAMN04488109_0090 [Chryseolinea serpens]
MRTAAARTLSSNTPTLRTMEVFKYSVKDLVLNESFQQWVLNPDGDGQSMWQSWQHQHFELLEEARTILLQLRDRVEEEIDADEHEVWNRLEQSLDEDEEKTLPCLTQPVHKS